MLIRSGLLLEKDDPNDDAIIVTTHVSQYKA